MIFKLKNHNLTLAFTIVIIISLILISSNEDFSKLLSYRRGPAQNVRCHHDKAPRFRYRNESAPQGKQFVYMYNVADCLSLDMLTKCNLSRSNLPKCNLSRSNILKITVLQSYKQKQAK